MKTLIKLASSSFAKTLPILGCIKFYGDMAVATDLEIDATTKGPWNFPEPRMVEVSLLKAAMSINKVPVWEGTKLNGIDLISDFDVSDFPLLKNVSNKNNEVFTEIQFSRPLHEIITRVKPAMAKNDIRYYLNGILFDLENNAVVTTDGHLMCVEKNAITSTDASKNAIIPRGVFDLIKKPLSIRISDKHAYIEHDGGMLLSKLIDGKFPDWRRVLPVNKDKIGIPFNRTQLENLKKIQTFNVTHKLACNSVTLKKDGSAISNDGKLKLPFGKPLSTDVSFFTKQIIPAMEATDGNGQMFFEGQYADLITTITRDDFSAVLRTMRP